jgi:hypothetical protein
MQAKKSNKTGMDSWFSCLHIAFDEIHVHVSSDNNYDNQFETGMN